MSILVMIPQIMQQKSNLLVLGILSLLLHGCGSPSTTQAPVTQKPFAGVNLTIASLNAPLAKVIEQYSQFWLADEAASLKVISVNDNQTVKQLSQQQADIWIIPSAQLGAWATTIELHAVPSQIQKASNRYGWLDLIPIYPNQLLVWHQKVCALPILGEAPICFYRKDLLDDPKHKDGFEKKFGRKLDIPKTWQDYHDISAYFFEKEQTSLTTLPKDPVTMDRLFFSIAVPYARRAVKPEEGSQNTPEFEDDFFSFHFDLHTGNPRITAPGFAHALGLLKKMQKFRVHPTQLSETPSHEFTQGKAVFYIGNPKLWATFEKVNSPVRRKVGCCLLPSSDFYFDYQTGDKVPVEENRVPYLGSESYLGIVPKSSANSKAAMALLANLGNYQIGQQIVADPTVGGAPFRRKHRSEAWHSLGIAGHAREQFSTVLGKIYDRNTRNPVLRLRVPKQREYMNTLVKEIQSSLTDDYTGDPLKVIEQKWNDLIQSTGKAEHLKRYRISLGLNP